MSAASYRPDVDGLRAVAIVGVLLFHAWPGLCPGGFVVVDVFFVISGFLITNIITTQLNANQLSFGAFYANRVKRIFPAMVVVLLACVAIGWVALEPRDYAQLGKHTVASAVFGENFMLWTESGYFDRAAQHKPLLHLWSLAIEEQFYVCYPPLVWLLWRAGRRVAAFSLAGLAAASFAANVLTVQEHASTAFFLPHTRVWELLSGGVLALRPAASAGDAWRRNASGALGLSLIAVAMATFDHGTPFPGWAALVPVAGTLLTLSAGRDAFTNRALLGNRAAVAIGLISYPLYLWHWPLLSLADVGVYPTSLIVRPAVVLVSFALAWLTFRLVEGPFRFGPRSNRAKLAVLVGGAIGAALLGVALQINNGFASRVPPAIRAIATWRYDYLTDARSPSCWLGAQDRFAQLGAECWGGLRQERGADTLVVWGDSHSARLYPGLVAALPSGTDFAQFSRNTCPPLLTTPSLSRRCRAHNARVLDALVQHHPRRVVVASAWQEHGARWTRDAAPGSDLLAVLVQLRAGGVQEIVVVGPAPQWIDELPNLIVRGYVNDPLHRVPRRLSMSLVIPEVRAVDAALASLTAGVAGVRYVSILDVVCTRDGCLAFASDAPDSFFSWDRAHLTTVGATFVARRLGL